MARQLFSAAICWKKKNCKIETLWSVHESMRPVSVVMLLFPKSLNLMSENSRRPICRVSQV